MGHSGKIAELVLVYGGGTALDFHQASPFVGSDAA